ncbi:MAG: hypothetical protein JRG71_00955 [Deltaproteobacteria bacterium]|nr:hypothetical protein [Deltaproteobacteria bacterium]
MSNFTNKRRDDFLKGYKDLTSVHDQSDKLTTKSKFNFSYFVSDQSAGQDFIDWDHPRLAMLLNKIKNYTEFPLEHWRNERVGRGGLRMFATYGKFPSKSQFTLPKHIPHEAEWGRFRLGSKIRLIGFTVPSELHNTPHNQTKDFFDKNTFYVVFLDRDHKFYTCEKA